ncbi:MAG TPA: hypothetical protein VGM20_05410 [Gemmatimonadales bacterium]|jgi:hypothetical protein
MNRRAFPAIAILLILACHSDSFPGANYGAIGPRTPGAEITIDSIGANPTWTDDGAGILYSGRCLTIHPPPSGTISAIDMQPPVSGSVNWSRCESRQPMIAKPDSAERFPAISLGSGARLLYVEAIGPNPSAPIPCICTPFPLGWHAELWFADTTGDAGPAPRKLQTLYHDHLGISPFNSTQVDWLTDLHWVGTGDFLALGINLNVLGFMMPLGVYRGNTGGAPMQLVTGTFDASHYSLAENGASIIFSHDSDSTTIRRVAVAGGTANVVAQIPAAPFRTIADISCKGTFCLVTTNSPTGSIFYGLDLDSQDVTELARDARTFLRAQLSPTSSSVVLERSIGAGRPDAIFLDTGLIH